MSNYAKRIAALLQQIQEEEAQTGNTLITAIYGRREETGKWELHTTTRDSTGKLIQDVIELDTQEEAEERISTLEAMNPPPPKGKKPEPVAVVNAMNMAYCE